MIEIRPSSTAELISPFLKDPISRGSTIYDFDGPHLVTFNTSADIRPSEIVHVYLGGTGSSPAVQHTTKRWLAKSQSLSISTIALSYIWGNYSDIEKNDALCLESKCCIQQQQGLKDYHHTLLFGGNSTLVSILEFDSILGRLKNLIKYMIKNSINAELWKSVSSSKKGDWNDIEINLNQFIFSGHSQGAGHVAYLAQKKSLLRAILFSGPQEFISQRSSTDSLTKTSSSPSSFSWLQDTFETKDIVAFMHEEEEATADLIRSNWLLINPLHWSNHSQDIPIEIYSSKLFKADADDSSIHTDELLPSLRQDIIRTKSRSYYDIHRQQSNCKCFYTRLKYSFKGSENNLRPNHCSTITDKCTPRWKDIQRNNNLDAFNSVFSTIFHDNEEDESNEAIYYWDIWEELLRVEYIA
mmetsp:Transcript_21723/g.31200  ORF Transcript_21723/g.31200 Transcript_21723/m.31200 type:complete len:412 (-) Transcript_21723:46-1281(-)